MPSRPWAGDVRRIARALALVVILAAAGPSGLHAALAPGDHQFTLVHQSLKRSYLVRVPPQAAGGAPLPVVINYHGGGGDARTQKWYTRMDTVADREGFIAVYPNGTGGLGTRLLTWNAGNCCGIAALNRVDDVGFTLAVLDDLAYRTPVDATRIYATGLSNGSMMAYRLAADAPQRVAAVAGVAGAMTLRRFKPARPVPVMHIHSLDDERALYSGGLGPAFPMTDTRVFHGSVDEMMQKWVAHNGCAGPGSVVDLATGKGADEGHTGNRIVWGPCREGVEVVLWKLFGPGHVWPGGQRDFLPLLLGTSSAVIDANREIWQFFARFRRDVASGPR
jgi:polyhydroxybutyrate depolymerase